MRNHHHKYASDMTPLEHRTPDVEEKKYNTLEDSPIDTTPHRHVAHASEPDHHRRAHARRSWIPFFIILFFVLLAIVAAIVGIFITRVDKSRDLFQNAKPTPTSFTAPTPTSLLSPEEKAQIHTWLAENTATLNPYGDPEGTVYAGGSPLFSEETSTKISIYDYIVSKHPDRPWKK